MYTVQSVQKLPTKYMYTQYALYICNIYTFTRMYTTLHALIHNMHAYTVCVV